MDQVIINKWGTVRVLKLKTIDFHLCWQNSNNQQLCYSGNITFIEKLVIYFLWNVNVFCTSHSPHITSAHYRQDKAFIITQCNLWKEFIIGFSKALLPLSWRITHNPSRVTLTLQNAFSVKLMVCDSLQDILLKESWVSTGKRT